MGDLESMGVAISSESAGDVAGDREANRQNQKYILYVLCFIR